MTALLEVRNVSKVFGGGLFSKRTVVAVDDVSLSLSADHPTITAVAGESGSGKTTLARLLLGIISPTEGEVCYKGKDIQKMSRAERKVFRREVQPIFQDPFEVYNPFYKVDHLLRVAVAKFKLAASKEKGRMLIRDALETVGLRPEETLGRFPHQLSGGQRQRVMVARALLLKPRIILADEPVSMVDASLRATILESLRKLNREIGISILYVTHDLTTAYQICDSIVVLYRGSVVEAGTVERVIQDPKHPYTQLLVESIPEMEVDRAWEEVRDEPPLGEDMRAVKGCKFVDRCPVAMDTCWNNVPPFYHVDPQRVASCFVYRDSPVLDAPRVSDVMNVGEQQEPAAAG